MLAQSPRGALLGCLATLASVFSSAGQARADAHEAPSRVIAVTVFQGQALVTREVELPDTDGLFAVAVEGLPERLVPGSLYAEPGGGVEVRSVRYREQPVETDTREEVQEIDAQIEQLSDELGAITKRRDLLGSRTEYLDSLEGFTASTAMSELGHGVLNAETLGQLTNLVFEQRERIAEEELDLTRRERELNQELELLKRERETLASNVSRVQRRAIVFLNAPEADGATLRLTYLVSGASWSPSYNLRADDDRTEVVVEYNASVQQMSGEDWEDVRMTLSTATPSLVAKAPSLDTLEIRLAALSNQQSYDDKRQELSRQQRMLAQNRGNFAGAKFSMGREAEDVFAAPNSGFGGGGGFGATYEGLDSAFDSDRGLNAFSCALQVLDYNANASQIRRARAMQKVQRNEGLSVVYRLENPTSLPSRSDRQLIQIASVPLEAEFYRVATPVLTDFVYEEAKLTNRSDMVFLAGPAATFVGDRFVGRGEAPSVSVGESFTAGFGIDESLRVSRELTNRRDRVQGGNRVVAFDYALRIENFGAAEAVVRLFDRLPHSKGSDIKITLLESDPEAQRVRGDSGQGEGILRWDIAAPANSTGEDAAAVTYTLQIEHDKNLSIVGQEPQP